MESENDHDELRRQLEEAVQALNPVERELWAAMQKFVDEQARAGGSRDSRVQRRAQSLAKGARHEGPPAASGLQCC